MTRLFGRLLASTEEPRHDLSQKRAQYSVGTEQSELTGHSEPRRAHFSQLESVNQEVHDAHHQVAEEEVRHPVVRYQRHQLEKILTQKRGDVKVATLCPDKVHNHWLEIEAFKSLRTGVNRNNDSQYPLLNTRVSHKSPVTCSYD